MPDPPIGCCHRESGHRQSAPGSIHGSYSSVRDEESHYFCRGRDFGDVQVDFIKRQPDSTFAGKPLDNRGVQWARSALTANPVVDRALIDAQV
jgi:hypothetical protein